MNPLPLVLLALAGPALSLPPTPSPPQPADSIWDYLAERYDGDKDGKISPEEYTRGKEAFGRLDRDGNGFIEPADSKVRGGSRRGRKERAEAPREGSEAPDFKLEILGKAPAESKGEQAKDQGARKKKNNKKQEDAEPGDKQKATPETVSLSSFQGKRPVALVFGSYT